MKNQSLLKLTLLLAASLTVMSGATIAPSLPAINELFDQVPNAALLTKLVLTLPALFIALAAPLVGVLVNRFGRLRLLYISLAIYAIAGSTGLWMNDLYDILIGRALLGVSVGGIMTVSSTLVGDYFVGEERNRFSGLQSLFMSAGGIVFVGLGGVLADMNWRFPFAIYLFSIIVMVLVAISLVEPKDESNTDNIANGHGRKLPYRSIGVILATLFVAMVVFYMTPVQIPFLLKERGTESASLSGLAIAFSTIGGAIGAGFYARLKRKLSFQKVFAITFVSLALGYAIVGIGSTYVLVLIGLLISGFGVGLLMPNGTVWLLELTPLHKRGTIMGLFTSALFIGQFASPIIAQPLATEIGLGYTFVVMAMVSGSIGLYYLITKSNGHREATPSLIDNP